MEQTLDTLCVFRYCSIMNTHAPNPFTGLKGALAGLMSGGWLGLLLGLLFRRRIAPMLAALETLFAQWKAGTLPIQAAGRVTAPVVAAGRQAAAPRARHRAGRRAPAAPAQPVAAAPRLRTPPVRAAEASRPLLPTLHVPLPLCRHGRCTEKTRLGRLSSHAHIITISYQ